MRFSLIAIVILIVGAGERPASARQDDANGNGQRDAVEISVAINEARSRLAEFLSKLEERLGLGDLADKTDGVITFDVDAERLTFRFDAQVMADRFAAMWRPCELTRERQAIVEPDPHGVKILPLNEEDEAVPARLVMLVHGLDDVGLMWDDLIPPLHRAGHRIAQFNYPNDGPIARSADLLAKELAAARSRGVRQIDVVAHSMGGLVVRDVLTRGEFYGGDGTGRDIYPAIDRFIMIATPNQGAAMARCRPLIGVGEQVLRLCAGENILQSNARDGDGEAAIDLRPNSKFLRDLNQRPSPQHTRFTIIAGKITGLDAERLGEWLDHLGAMSLDRAQITSTFSRTVNTVGDGCVSLESARLEHVEDVVIVRGNHLSILRNFTPRPHAPAAIPIVLDRLSTTAAD